MRGRETKEDRSVEERRREKCYFEAKKMENLRLCSHLLLLYCMINYYFETFKNNNVDMPDERGAYVFKSNYESLLVN